LTSTAGRVEVEKKNVAQILSYMVEVIGLFFIMAASVGLGYLIHQGEVRRALKSAFCSEKTLGMLR